MDQNIRKFNYIDALRGIAIILVMMVHTSQRVIPEAGSLMSRIFRNGDKGVQLFFVLSALTLCFSLNSRKRNESQPVLYFFIRRFFRIAPLFYLAIIFYQFPFDLNPSYYAPNGIKPWYFLSAFTFTHGWHPETYNSIVPGSWSIATEFSFYLLLPLLFRFINSKEKAVLFFVFTGFINFYISSELRDYWLEAYQGNPASYLVYGVWYYGIFNQLPVFAIGIFMFHILKENIVNNSRLRSVSFLLLGCIVLLNFTEFTAYKHYINQLAVFGIGFSLIIYALANRSLSLFVNPVFRYTGQVSYSMYFVHFAVIDYMTRYNFWGLSQFKNAGTIIALLLVFAVTIGISTITFYLVEKNGIRFGSWIINKLEEKKLRQISKVEIAAEGRI